MPDLWESVVNSGAIANFQTLFNLITAIALLPFTNLLVKAACLIVKDEEEQEEIYPELAALDKKLMNVPAVALGEVKSLAVMMANVAKENLALSLKQLKKYDEKRTEVILAEEDRLDRFTDKSDNYLIRLSSQIESDSDHRQLNVLMQSIRDIERIGDYATNFDEMGKKLYDTECSFSKTALQEIEILGDAVLEIIRLTIEALESESEYITRRIEPLEEVIDDMVLLLKNRHTARLCKGKCSIDAGMVYMDALINFERAADHCSNIAMQLLGKDNEEIMKNHHRYLEELHISSDESYLAEHENRKAQYIGAIENI